MGLNFTVYEVLESAVASLHHRHSGHDFFNYEFALAVLSRLESYGEDHDGQALHDELMNLIADYVAEPNVQAEKEEGDIPPGFVDAESGRYNPNE
jgi:hypothetical protein